MVKMKIMLCTNIIDLTYFKALEDCNKKNHQHYAQIEHSVDDLHISNRKLLIFTYLV